MAKPLWIGDFLNLDLISAKIQDRNEARSDYRTIRGLDTETDENGNIILLADDSSKEHYIDKITAHNVIKFLFEYQGSWNFFYNLTFDAEVILKLLGSKLYDYTKTRKLEFKFEDYRIQYFPTKKLAILKGKKSAVFFDIAQFYNTSLVNAYLENNLGILSDEYLQMKSKRDSFTRNYYARNKKLVRKYCIQDCIMTKKVSEHWVNRFHDLFDFLPSRWLSSGYLAEKVLVNKKIKIPYFQDLNYDVQKFAWQSYYGGKYDIVKRGFIGKAYQYDINSAYPYAFSTIPDITKGEWIQSKTLEKDALLGFARIEADIPYEKYIPPFPFRYNKKLIFPSGKFITTCTLAELRSCRNPQYYTILDSYQYFDDSPEYPYKEFIESLYQKRLQLQRENNPQEKVLKKILNSMYGKLAQRVGYRIGNLYSPILASTITGMARAMLYDFIYKHGIENDVVGFATDSIISTKKIDIDSSELGNWKKDNEADDVYILQNGINRFNGIWKKRGIGKLGNMKIEDLQTLEEDGKLYQVFDVTRVSRLKECILSHRIEDIGKFNIIKRRVRLNADKKRSWFDELKDINDGRMNDSLPLPIDLFNTLDKK